MLVQRVCIIIRLSCSVPGLLNRVPGFLGFNFIIYILCPVPNRHSPAKLHGALLSYWGSPLGPAEKIEKKGKGKAKKKQARPLLAFPPSRSPTPLPSLSLASQIQQYPTYLPIEMTRPKSFLVSVSYSIPGPLHKRKIQHKKAKTQTQRKNTTQKHNAKTQRKNTTTKKHKPQTASVSHLFNKYTTRKEKQKTKDTVSIPPFPNTPSRKNKKIKTFFPTPPLS